MKNQPKLQQKLIQVLKNGVLLIIVLVPFYAFFTTWIGSNTGGLLLLRAWKELLLVVLAVIALYFFIQDKKLRSRFLSDRLFWAIAVFTAWVLGVSAFLARGYDATLLGLAIQLRPLVFFVVASVIVFYVKISEPTLVKLITLPAIGVVAFGLLQIFIVPHDFLKHFGYQKNLTIPPFFTIDDQLNKLRIASTLRGPNPLGVYLIAPLLLVISRFRSYTASRDFNRLLFAIIYLLLSTLVLYASHSRSAWLGAAAAGALYIWLIVSKKWKLVFLAGALITVMIGAGVVYQYRQTTFVQDVLLHDNEDTGGEISSNGGRVIALKNTVKDIRERPLFGCGVGCAGPASAHHENGGKISENFYLQTIQELGVPGLVLLLFVHTLVIVRLLRLNTSFSKAWLAVFVGVSVASLLSHAWADDTITYIWWGIAGLLLYNTAQKNKQNQRYEKTAQTKKS